MNITFTGKIIKALPLQQGQSRKDGSTWFKQEFVIEELNQQYPARCCFQVFGSDKLQQLAISEGEVLTVSLSIRANESKEGRWFNQLECWKVERFNGQQPSQPAAPMQPQPVYQSQPAAPQQQMPFPPQPNNAPW